MASSHHVGTDGQTTSKDSLKGQILNSLYSKAHKRLDNLSSEADQKALDRGANPSWRSLGSQAGLSSQEATETHEEEGHSREALEGHQARL